MDFLKDLSLDKVRNLAEDAFNQAKPKTDLEAKVYEILSHKNWGSSSTLLNEISRDTFDYDKFAVISQLTWEAMENQRPAAWRVVFKGLTLLEHLIKNGSERCVDDARNHGHTLRALNQFNYYEGTIDRGLGVREKSKQIIEMLADDERIREERQRARKLREKFGNSGGGVGGGSGGGGGGGYGNDNWESGSGMKGATGGYGDGGIGSKAAGRYDSGGEDRRGDSTAAGNFSGRYGNDATATTAATPTFAAMPDDVPKKAKSKKKKSVAPAAPAPTVDLFSFDDPSPTPAPAPSIAQDDDFDSFQSAGGPSSEQAAAFADPFAAPTQPSMSAPSQQSTFDAFDNGGGSMAQAQFGSFSNTPLMGSTNVMSGGNMNQQQQQQRGMMQKQQNDDNDFGDFAGAASSKSSSVGPVSSNPMNKLISLDGLSKNTNKLEDKLNQPIIANAAAATFVQEREQIQANVQQSSKGSSMSFSGIDGLHKQPSMMSGGMGGHMNPGMMMAPGMSMGMNPSVMGTSSTSGNFIGMLDPAEMMQKKPEPQTAPQQGMMNPQMQQGMLMNPQMQQGMMMNPQMQQGMMMNPQMQQGMMMNPQMQPDMMHSQMMGGAGMQGFSNGGMQQGNSMNQQQQMAMNQGMNTTQNGFGNQNMNNFGGLQNGGMGGGGSMGGQPMGGFR